MILEIFGFLHMSIADILDIAIVAAIIYGALKWIKGSTAMNIFIGVMIVLFSKIVAEALSMRLLSSILGAFIDIGVIALVVIFQPEIRHFLMRVGKGGGRLKQGQTFIRRLFGAQGKTMESESINEIAAACQSMSETKTGALIVFPHESHLQTEIESGDKIDAKINRRLIMNIFFKNSPLHDGAMIISDDRIVAARCTLPNTERTDLPAQYGMRHKAAIGVTEHSDADVIVVSEETGKISFGHGGTIEYIENINRLKQLLTSSFAPKEKDKVETNTVEETVVEENID